MKKVCFIIFILLQGLPYIKAQDSIKINDTVTLAQDKIQNIEIRCNGPGQPKMINSQVEFSKLFGNDCQTTSTIDFSYKTLFYFPTMTMGCKPPEYIRSVKFVDKKVFYSINIIEHGSCFIAIKYDNCIIVPKINSNYTPYYIKTETRMKF